MVRMTAEERREEILRAAVDEFARRGFQGASTTAIAHGAGVSQPYLFQLFPGKHALFLAVLERGFAQAQDAMTEAAAELTGPAAIEAMRARYLELVTESGLVQLQFQVYCAALDDPEIRDAALQAWAERLAVE